VLLGWHPLLVIVLGGIVAALGGLFIAAPALRLRGPYLALMTLVAALGLDKLMRLLKPEIGTPGAEGAILCIPDCFISYDPITKYYYSLALMAVCFVVLYRLARSRIGLTFEAIRDDEEAAQAAGINTAKYKTLAFTVSGFIAGMSGAFYVYHIGSASPLSLLNLERSIEAIVASVIGGMGTIIGPVFGAYFFIITQEYLRPLQVWRFLTLFAVAILVLFFVPRGMLPELGLKLKALGGRLRSWGGRRARQEV
jgi:branched-chain amino acid transport system permease protein